ncbi:universal stress protein UspA [Glutamicibacter halophytocola]|uniref:universal stress protein n=1 Tax=Glutamicibacter halophytocola TaxID=1933880 RepID=UPI0006D49D40|nr:universal stress protein [Glutamicibacter halophytocola]ALG27576.1 universal stress protein UspA [Glutamicibacter halophytocola]
MSETIIVGVDGSETAQRAARRAAELALKIDAELVVVTAHASDNTEVVSIGSDTWILDDAEQARKLAQRVANDVKNSVPGVKITAAAGHGKPGDVLISDAENRKASMIVVGNVGMKGLGRVLGSVASSVAHSAPCDVLVVKTDK